MNLDTKKQSESLGTKPVARILKLLDRIGLEGRWCSILKIK